MQLVEVNEVMHRVTRDEGGMLRSPAPALVVATPIAVGDEVAAGASVLVLESMKMETVLHAPFAGRVRELLVKTGSQVETGAPLLRIEPVAEAGDGAEAAEQSGPDLELPEPARTATADERAARGLDALSAILLGFDSDADTEAATLAGYLAAREEARTGGHDVVGREIDLLNLFADLAELSRNRPGGEELHTELRVHSSREHFHTYLQSLDVERHGLHEQFRDRLAAVLARYGVTELDRTPELEEAVFRIFLAQRRTTADVHLVSSLLQRWITEPAPAESLTWPVRQVLDRLVRATQLRFPVVGDLARSVRFRWFDQPLVDEDRSSVLAGVSGELSALVRRRRDRPRRPDRRAGRDPRADRPLPRRAAGARASPSASRCSRCWSGGTTASSTCTTCGSSTPGRPFVVADYVLDETRPTHLVSTLGTIDELGDPTAPLATAIADQVAARPAGHAAVVDLYLSLARRAAGSRGDPGRAGRAGRRAAVRRRRTPDRGRGLPRRRPPGQLLHPAPGDRRRRRRPRWSRTTWSAASTRWSAAG